LIAPCPPYTSLNLRPCASNSRTTDLLRELMKRITFNGIALTTSMHSSPYVMMHSSANAFETTASFAAPVLSSVSPIIFSQSC
jgi:hypothetical protein